MTAHALPAIPPVEYLVCLPAPRFPSLVELMARVIEQNLMLDWVLVETLLVHLKPAFTHTSRVRTLAQWAEKLSPQLPLRNPIPEYGISLDTRALRIEHPALPEGRHYFLLEGNPEYPMTFLDPTARELDGTYLFRRWHIATLNSGTLFPPEIVRLVFRTFSFALLYAPKDVMSEVDRAFMDFGRELEKLFIARGMKW